LSFAPIQVCFDLNDELKIASTNDMTTEQIMWTLIAALLPIPVATALESSSDSKANQGDFIDQQNLLLSTNLPDQRNDC